LPAQGHEAQALGWSGPRAAYVREVVLRVDGLPVVFARSLTAYPDSLGAWRSLRGLGSRPLADVLFLRQGIARSPLQFTSIKPAAALRRQIARQWMAATGQSLLPRSLPARRSVFRHAGAPLLVMEVFAALPAPWNWPIE
jgi:chorismate--pyruvate lyase